MAYDKTTDMQTLTGSAAFLQCQNNFIALKDSALSIDGVKTFTSSPIVPTPTTDMQASTKKYVDDKAVALTGDQTIAGVKTFSTPIAVGSGGTGSTAAANAASGVVVLNASSQLPAVSGALLTGVLTTAKVYDSGAQTWTANTVYTITHNLNSTVVMTQVFIRPNDTYDWETCRQHRDNGYMGNQAVQIDTVNAVKIAMRENFYFEQTGALLGSGQFRIIILAVG